MESIRRILIFMSENFLQLVLLLPRVADVVVQQVEQCAKLRYRWQAQAGTRAAERAPRAELGSLRRYLPRSSLQLPFWGGLLMFSEVLSDRTSALLQ